MPGAIQHAFSNAVADGTNTNIVRPSDWNSQHNYTLQDAVSVGGNTAGVLTLISAGLLLLAGGSNVTLSQNGNSVTVSAANAPAIPVFSNSNGVSFGTNAGTVTATVATNYQSQGAYLTTAMQSQSSSVFAKTGFTTTTVAADSIAGTLNTDGLKLAVPAYLTTAGLSQDSSKYAFTGFTTTTIAGAVVAGTHDTAGLKLAVPAYLTTAQAPGAYQSAGAYLTTADLSANSSNYARNWKLTGNSAGTQSSAIGTDLWLAGGQGITVSGSSNSISLSVGSYITTGRASTDALGLNTAGTNITWTANSSGLSINASGYAGTGFTSGTTTGGWAATLNTAGLSEVMPYRTRHIYPEGGLTALTAPANASQSFQYLPLRVPLTGTRIDALISMSAGSAATSNTAALAFSAYVAIYTRNGASLSSLSSGSTQTTYSYASNSAGQTQLTQAAIRPMSVPINFNMPPGEYFIGFNLLSNTSSIGANTTNLGLTMSMMGGNGIQTAANYAEITDATATSKNLYSGMGVYSAASTGLLSGVSLSGINQTGSALSAAHIALVFRNA